MLLAYKNFPFVNQLYSIGNTISKVYGMEIKKKGRYLRPTLWVKMVAYPGH